MSAKSKRCRRSVALCALLSLVLGSIFCACEVKVGPFVPLNTKGQELHGGTQEARAAPGPTPTATPTRARARPLRMTTPTRRLKPTASSPSTVPPPTVPPPTPSPALTPVARRSPNERRALRYLQETYGLNLANLVIVHQELQPFPLTDRVLWRAKILDPAGGPTYGVAIDEGGQIVDPDGFEQAERGAYRARYGKLEPALHDLLQTKRDDERVKVGIWRADGDHAQASLKAFLKERGFEVTFTSRAAPLVFAELPKRLILAVAEMDEVGAIYLARQYQAK